MADLKDTNVTAPEADIEVGSAADVEEIMKKYDRESNTRIYEGMPKTVIHYLLAAFSLFIMWMNLFANWGEQFRRPLFLGFVVLFVFLIFPARKGHPGKINRIPWYDMILMVVGAGSFFYFVVNNQSILARATRITDLEVADECHAMDVKTFFDALANGAQNCLSIAVACGIAGIIAGVVTMTGLGQVFISAIVGVACNHLIIALLLTMVTCIILGMGVPTTANYVIMATTCAPILTTGMGMDVMAANMFVFYFGIVADITPPVALAAYAGSAIAKAPPMRTALNATRLAIAAFLVPYIFALNPAMLFIDTVWYEVVLIVLSSFIGMIAISVALEGYLLRHVNPLGRILCAMGGLALLVPGTLTDLAGLIVLVIVAAIQVIENRRDKAAKAA